MWYGSTFIGMEWVLMFDFGLGHGFGFSLVGQFTFTHLTLRPMPWVPISVESLPAGDRTSNVKHDFGSTLRTTFPSFFVLLIALDTDPAHFGSGHSTRTVYWNTQRLYLNLLVSLTSTQYIMGLLRRSRKGEHESSMKCAMGRVNHSGVPAYGIHVHTCNLYLYEISWAALYPLLH